MPEIHYKQFDQYLTQTAQPPGAKVFSGVYLIFGEELLFKKVHDALVDALLPSPAEKLNHEKIDGDPANIPTVLNHMKTYSLLAGKKVVSFQETVIFYGVQNKDKLLENAKTAWRNADIKKAAGYVLNVMARSGLTLDDVLSDGRGLSLLSASADDAQWLEKVLDFCKENRLSPPSEKDVMTMLQDAVQKGFPKHNHLIITTDFVDKRRVLYTVLKEHGVVVDCSVPKGNRQADRQVQEEVLRDRMAAILTPVQKKLEPRALSALMEMTGFDLRTFCGNLEKLVLFVGDRTTITREDVAGVLERTREDPVFDFTGAVSDRNIDKSLFLLKSLLAQNSHPLQILAALINHFRKVLLAKAFTTSSQGRVWRPGMDFNLFKSSVLPAAQAYDAQLSEVCAPWESIKDGPDEETADGEATAAPKKKQDKKKKNLAADLAVAQNPANPYPIYVMLKKADLFSMEELLNAYIRLSDIDIQLKRTGLDPQLLLEAAVMRICAR